VSTTFNAHRNNVSTTLSQAYFGSGGNIYLASGAGASFGSTFPLIFTISAISAYGSPAELTTIFQATGRSTDILTNCTVIEGSTDRNYAVGDRVEMRWTAGQASSIETAVNNLENTVVYTSGTYSNPSWLTALDGSKITTGTIAAARLGTGTASNQYILRGDGTWVYPVGNTTASSNYTALGTDNLLLCNATSAAFTVTLPAASSSNGHELIIMKYDATSNAVTITRQGTDGIIGSGTTGPNTGYSLAAYGKIVRMVAVGANWFITGQN